MSILLFCPLPDFWQHVQKMLSDFLRIIFVSLYDKTQSIGSQDFPESLIFLILEFILLGF